MEIDASDAQVGRVPLLFVLLIASQVDKVSERRKEMSAIVETQFGIEQMTLNVSPTETKCAGRILLDKIATRQAVISVIGLGYVGLPLAVAFAEAGFSVVGIDTDTWKVNSLNMCKSYIQDVPSERLRALAGEVPGDGHSNMIVKGLPRPPLQFNDSRQNGGDGKSNGHAKPGTFYATTDADVLHEVDAVIICVPTPVTNTKDPDLTFITSAVDAIVPRLHQGMLISLESTTYPGTTDEVVLPRLNNSTLQVGEDFFVAFSPERIDPQRTDWTVRNTPKVIGGVTPLCSEVAYALYSSALDRIVPVTSPKTAEMVKLLENTFRAVNIALANEMAIMCNRLGVDIWEVIEAAKTKPYGFMPFYPGPGVGGHCIPVDPLYLSWKMKALNYNARLISVASEINAGMPEYVCQLIADALNDECKSLKRSRVLILGVSYKPNVNDIRESPVLEVIRLLRSKDVDVVYHDPYVPSLKLDGISMNLITLDSESLQAADCVVIGTDHQSYNWSWVMEHSHLIVDTRNATRGVHAGNARVVKV
jgi:UDP-N-acetyl-D-glucosamine dehydrogenase